MDSRAIGLFDSGVGGLTIWRAIRKLLPDETLTYIADAAHAPYGGRPPETLRDRATRVARVLLERDAKLIVVACNTATVHTIGHLRETFSGTPFVGVVPVVKTLVSRTRTGAVALLSTGGTSESAYLAGLIEEFAPDKRVLNIGGDGLEELVEAGDVDSERVDRALERVLAPLRDSDVDAVGLGCTHYPFLRRRIKRALGDGVRVYDPSRPVARRVRQLLTQRDAVASVPARDHRFFTTGDPGRFAAVASKLLRTAVTGVERVDV